MNRHRTTSCRQAFSLIELTMVVLLIGLVAAIGAPRFANHVRVVKLEAAARQLAAHIDYVRQVAINEGRSTSLTCRLYQYKSDDVDAPESIAVPLQVRLRKVYDPSFMLAADFDARSRLSFDFEGVPHVGGSPLVSGTVAIFSGNDQFVVAIAPGTGRTSVSRGAMAVMSGSAGGSL